MDSLTLPEMRNPLPGTTAINAFKPSFTQDASDNEFGSTLAGIGDSLTTDLTALTEDPTYAPTEYYDVWPAHLMWIQKTFATLSILASYVIIREVTTNLRRQQQQSGRRSSAGGTSSGNSGSSSNSNNNTQGTIARIMLSLSVSDILFSSALFLGEWAMPADTPYVHHAMGNQHTCNFQGWLVAFGYLTSPMFSVALNLAFLLLIKFRWSDQQLRALEFPLTIGIWIYGFVWSIIPIPFDSYNADYDLCWVSPYPSECTGDDCEWGFAAFKLQWYFSYIHVWVCVLICIGLMLALFFTVRKIEKRADQWRSRSKRTTSGRLSSTTSSAMVPSSSSTHSLSSPTTSNSRRFSPSSAIDASGAIVETSNAAAARASSCLSSDSGLDDDEKEENDEETGKTQLDGGISTDDDLSDADICLDDDVEEDVEEEDKEGTNYGYGDSTSRNEMSSRRVERRGSIGLSRISATPSTITTSNNHRSKNSSRRGSRSVAYQGILYTIAFLCTHLLDAIAMIIWHATHMWYPKFDTAAYMVFQPSLGVFNLLIYCRNRQQMSTPEGRFARAVLYFPCTLVSCLFCGRGPFCSNSSDDDGEQQGRDTLKGKRSTNITRNSSGSMHLNSEEM